jgi:hypothetical protein
MDRGRRRSIADNAQSFGHCRVSHARSLYLLEIHVGVSDTIRWGSYALSEWLIIGWSIRHFPPLAAAAIVPRSELPAGE